MEFISLIILCNDLGYIQSTDYKAIRDRTQVISFMINKLWDITLTRK
jgi:hypothetical protein